MLDPLPSMWNVKMNIFARKKMVIDLVPDLDTIRI
jgi:hypothetical protein